MPEYTIYHNPRCSKSRQTLQLLVDNGVEPEIVLYLETPLNATQLSKLLSKLGMAPRDLLRKGETAYKEGGLADTSWSDSQLISAMVAEPKLIERPVVVRGERAILGRPPENVLSLLA
ncbi:arsenate reductase (glutaredoxin) [Zhongshania sp.]|jgi:arsenate reductase|uniref:arsenate reductase (glutaredoxin) n=1 Tax=Zhongshania sp. TaxID=1971902 RepID=UPI0039E2A6AF